MTTMFDRLLERMPDIHLVDDGPARLRPANFVSGIESLPVDSPPRRPSAVDRKLRGRSLAPLEARSRVTQGPLT